MNALNTPKRRDEVLDEAPRECPRCSGQLQIHQPDFDLPSKLLATCDHCKAWFLTGPLRSRFRWLTDARRPSGPRGQND